MISNIITVLNFSSSTLMLEFFQLQVDLLDLSKTQFHWIILYSMKTVVFCIHSKYILFY